MKQQTKSIFMDETQAFEQMCFLNCKIRKSWGRIEYHFCRFGWTSVVNLAKGFGAPSLNLTEHSTATNVLYQNHFDLKFYPRSLKL